MWAALLASGVDPVVAGLAIGLTAPAYSPGTRASSSRRPVLVRLFREQPTPDLARTATASLTATLSPNERLQTLYHPWTSYLIVPLFALANAGIELDSGLPAHGVHRTDHARHPGRLRGRQAGRGGAHVAGW